jgi:hypothetical protein
MPLVEAAQPVAMKMVDGSMEVPGPLTEATEVAGATTPTGLNEPVRPCLVGWELQRPGVILVVVTITIGPRMGPPVAIIRVTVAKMVAVAEAETTRITPRSDNTATKSYDPSPGENR